MGRQRTSKRTQEATLHELVAESSHADKHSLTLHLLKKVLPCKGMGRPAAVGSKPDLALHVPISLFHEDGHHHRTANSTWPAL